MTIGQTTADKSDQSESECEVGDELGGKEALCPSTVLTAYQS